MTPAATAVDFIAPMLAGAGPLPPADGAWAAELKWDGVRVVSVIDARGKVRCWSRNHLDTSVTWPELADLGHISALRRAGGSVLDGEVVSFDAKGAPSFGRLQRRMRVTTPARVAVLVGEVPIVYLVFDILTSGGRSLLGASYDERRAALAEIGFDGERVLVPEGHPDPAALFALSRDRGLEGVVCKRRASRYQPGRRSPDWVKTKNVHDQEVVIGGWRPGQGNRDGGIGSLLLGVPDENGALRYVGHVGTGFDRAALAELAGLLGPLQQSNSPFADPLPTLDGRDAVFAAPEIVGEVEFSEWTADGRLRHPVWRGLRTDKAVADVRRE